MVNIKQIDQIRQQQPKQKEYMIVSAISSSTGLEARIETAAKMITTTNYTTKTTIIDITLSQQSINNSNATASTVVTIPDSYKPSLDTGTYKQLIKHSTLVNVTYSKGLTFKEIGKICSTQGNYKYSCNDAPYCDTDICVHDSFDKSMNKMKRVVISLKKYKDEVHRYFDMMEHRLEVVDGLLTKFHQERNIEKRSQPLFLMFVNFGYIYQLFNFLCSCEKNGIDKIKKDMIVLTTDGNAQKLLNSIGIFTINVYDVGDWMNRASFEETASRKFGAGVHSKINSQSIGLLTDMIQLGYDVFVMDADLVWRVDPRAEMIKMAVEKNYDGLFLSDGRRYDYIFPKNSKTPLAQFRDQKDFDHNYITHNSGFFYIRSSNKMKEFTATLMQGLIVISWKKTDQLWWNTLIYHRKFSHVKFGMLPENSYYPGSRISTTGVVKGIKKQFPKDHYTVAHVSDTGSHLRKITKFYLSGLWYLDDACSLFNICLKQKTKSSSGCLPENYQDYFVLNTTQPSLKK